MFSPAALYARWRRDRLERRSRTRRVVFCTIATQSFVPWALVLLDALARHHPGAERLLLYVRMPDEAYRLPLIEGVKVIGVDSLVGAETEAKLRRRYGMAELCFALKARLLHYALDRYGDRAIYLDSDIDVQGPLAEALYALEEASVVLTPHLDTPVPLDGKAPTPMTILRAGTFNAGFIGAGECAETRAMLDWWDESVARWGYLAPDMGYQGDQKWLELAPALFPGVRALRDPGSNLGAWNLHSRRIERGADGALRVNGAPLAFVHFSGFDPEAPEVLSRFQNRHDPRDHPELAALARDFGARVMAAAPRAEEIAWIDGPMPPVEVETGTPRADRLPEGGYRARIECRLDPEGILSASEELVIDATVTNDSPHSWNVARNEKGEGGIALTWHLRTTDGAMLVRNHPRSWLTRDLAPGESESLTLAMRVPATPGLWRIELDLVHEGFTWFADEGSPTLSFEIAVDGLPPGGAK